MMRDVTIIGAGVIGCAIARELSQYQLDILVLEKEADVAEGTSKANSAIVHSGYDCHPGTLKARLNVEGCKLYPTLAKQLNFPFEQIGSLVLAFDEKDTGKLERLYEQGVQNGVDGLQLLSKEEVLIVEPRVNPEVTMALYSPSAGITCPYEATLAMAENAVMNHVTFSFHTPVVSIEKSTDGYCINGTIYTKAIINAAGLYSDEIARMIGDTQYQIIPRKGEYLLLDKPATPLYHHVLFQLPTAMGKGVLITPTVDHNILIGPTALDQLNKEDTSVSASGLEEVKQMALQTSRQLPLRTVITEFAGIRAVCGDDFIIEESLQHARVFHLIGIASPGLASAPAIACYVRKLIEKSGIILSRNETYLPYRKKPVRTKELSLEEYDALIQENPLYGKIVCRCEMVSEQEIIDALTSVLPATTMDGVKRRVRAGMGRCQGGFCGATVMELLAQYGKQEFSTITKNTPASTMVVGLTKGGNPQ